MSQIYTSSTVAPPPVDVPTQFTMDDATLGIPVANNINLFSRETSDDNDNGIQTTADPDNGDNLYVELTNRVTGTLTTNDAVEQTILSLSLGAVPGVYVAQGDITAYNQTDIAGASYTFVGAMRTDGASATEIGVENKNTFEEAAMATADFSVQASGNNLIVTVIGVAGKTINWNAFFTYRFVG